MKNAMDDSYLPVSVCIPVYNAAPYLRECLDSVLAQTFRHFELLIVDDGSTDDSVEIVRSYQDSRIRLIENRHNYIETLNLLLEEARGKYIARMDADDIMLVNRLQVQFDYLENHPDVGVLGGGFQRFGVQEGIYHPSKEICMQDMINSCCIAHPTVMMRHSIFHKYKLAYSHKYKYAEDYHLWLEMMKKNVVFHNIVEPVIKYRTTHQQVSSVKSDVQIRLSEKIRKNAALWYVKKIRQISHEKVFVPESKKELTVVIPFLNEREEVVETVRSIRETVGSRVEIIVVNDCSDKDFDYVTGLSPYNVTYVRNSFRIGAAASKHKGILLSRTPYFLLLDAHMRCLTKNWDRKIIQYLKQDKSRIICCQNFPLKKGEESLLGQNYDCIAHGAYLTFDYNGYIPGIRWLNKSQRLAKLKKEIPAVLGAAYASNKEYWLFLKGFEGLMHYGSEEAYISIKSWMGGNGCLLLPNVIFGHIYREAPPYRMVRSNVYYNLYVIAKTLFPTSLWGWAVAIGLRENKAIFREIMFWLQVNREETERLRTYYSSTFERPFQEIMKINNLFASEKIRMALHERRRWRKLLQFLCKTDKQETIGLYEGKMGRLIVLCESSRLKKAEIPEQEDFANEMLAVICDTILQNKMSDLSFSHGICGVGWGLMYLRQNGFVDDDFEEELQQIDIKIQELSPVRMVDSSLSLGLGGVLCYVVNRLADLKKKGGIYPYDKGFMEELKVASQRMLDEADIDFRTRSYALQFLEYEKDTWRILSPQWADVLDLPHFLPSDAELWKKGMEGAWGYLCNLSLVLQSYYS